MGIIYFMFKNFCKINSKNLGPSPHQAFIYADSSFIGSQANQAILLSTTIFLIAGRAGLAPSVNKPADANLKLQPRYSGLKTADPAGFTAVDTLAFGAMGHIVGVGIYLGTVGGSLQ